MSEWKRPRYDLRDLDPTMPTEAFGNSAFRERQSGAERFRAGSEGAGEVGSLRYLRPLGRTRHRVESTSAPGQVLEVPATIAETAFRPGQRVASLTTRSGTTIVGRPPSGEQGISQLPTVRRESTADVLRIDTLTPSTLTAGTTADVSASGFGFVASPLDVVIAVVLSEVTLTWGADSLITVDTVVWVSATELTLTITVSSAAEADHPISLQYSRG